MARWYHYVIGAGIAGVLALGAWFYFNRSGNTQTKPSIEAKLGSIDLDKCGKLDNILSIGDNIYQLDIASGKLDKLTKYDGRDLPINCNLADPYRTGLDSSKGTETTIK